MLINNEGGSACAGGGFKSMHYWFQRRVPYSATSFSEALLCPIDSLTKNWCKWSKLDLDGKAAVVKVHFQLFFGSVPGMKAWIELYLLECVPAQLDNVFVLVFAKYWYFTFSLKAITIIHSVITKNQSVLHVSGSPYTKFYCHATYLALTCIITRKLHWQPDLWEGLNGLSLPKA